MRKHIHIRDDDKEEKTMSLLLNNITMSIK